VPPLFLNSGPAEDEARTNEDDRDFADNTAAAADLGDFDKRDSRMRRVSNFLRFGKRAAFSPSAVNLSLQPPPPSPPICEDYLPPGFCTQIQLAKYGTQKKIKPFLRFGR
jgi:hypothetical protein